MFTMHTFTFHVQVHACPQVDTEVRAFLDSAFDEKKLPALYQTKHAVSLARAATDQPLLLEDAAEVAVSTVVDMHMSRRQHDTSGASCCLQ